MTISQNAFLRSTGFQISLRADKYAGLDCQIQSFVHPTVSSGNGIYVTPRRDIPVPGDKYQFDPLTATILLEQDLASYITAYEWLQECIENKDEPNFRNKTSDITLTIVDTKNNKSKRITYKNAFPSDLGSISFAVTDTSDEYLTCDIIFQYSHFEIS